MEVFNNILQPTVLVESFRNSSYDYLSSAGTQAYRLFESSTNFCSTAFSVLTDRTFIPITAAVAAIGFAGIALNRFKANKEQRVCYAFSAFTSHIRIREKDINKAEPSRIFYLRHLAKNNSRFKYLINFIKNENCKFFVIERSRVASKLNRDFTTEVTIPTEKLKDLHNSIFLIQKYFFHLNKDINIYSISKYEKEATKVHKSLTENLKEFISLKGDKILLLDEKSEEAWEQMVEECRNLDFALDSPLPVSSAKSARK